METKTAKQLERHFKGVANHRRREVAHSLSPYGKTFHKFIKTFPNQ